MNVGFVSGRLFRQGRLDYVLLDYVYFELENSFCKTNNPSDCFLQLKWIIFLILINFLSKWIFWIEIRCSFKKEL